MTLLEKLTSGQVYAIFTGNDDVQITENQSIDAIDITVLPSGERVGTTYQVTIPPINVSEILLEDEVVECAFGYLMYDGERVLTHRLSSDGDLMIDPMSAVPIKVNLSFKLEVRSQAKPLNTSED